MAGLFTGDATGIALVTLGGGADIGEVLCSGGLDGGSSGNIGSVDGDFPGEGGGEDMSGGRDGGSSGEKECEGGGLPKIRVGADAFDTGAIGEWGALFLGAIVGREFGGADLGSDGELL